MSTLPAHQDVRVRAERLWEHPRSPWLVLAALCVVAFALILRAGRGLFFFGDEWAFLLTRSGFSPEVVFAPHNEHPVAVGVITFKALQTVFGMSSYVPYQVMIALLHIATGVAIYLYTRRRVGPRLALVPAALMLFLGAGWEDVMWPFQIAFIGAVLFGLVSLLAFDARKDWLACVALVLSCMSSGLGFPFLGIALIEILWDERRWRRLWVVIVPVGFVALSLVGYGNGEHNALTSPSAAVRWALEMAAGGFGAFGAVGINWGRSLALVAVIAFVLGIRSGRIQVGRRLVALVLGVLAYWYLIASGRASLQGLPPDTSRYLYMSAALLLVIFATALGRTAVTRWGGLALAAATLVACVSGAGLFKAGPATQRANAPGLKMRLAALEAVRGEVPAEAQVDAAFNPDIKAEAYYAATEEHGSPAPSLAEVRAASDGERQVFDGTLVALLGLSLQPTGERTGGTCTTVAPDGEAVMPAGGAYRLTASGGTAGIRLRRLAGTVAADATPWDLPDGAPLSLELRPDALREPWRAIVSGAPVRVCRVR